MSHPIPARHQSTASTVAAPSPIRGRPTHRSRVLAGCLALAACGRPAAEPPHLSAEPPDTAALERTIPKILRVSGVPGLAMAVVDRGRVVWTGAFGNVTDPQTIFEAASLSKPVFAYLVLRLVDRGELDLDRPLAEMLEYPRAAGDPRYRRITGRMVLSHRFVAAVLTGRGLKPATWKAYLTPVRESGPGLGVGLGIRVEDGPHGRQFYHSGNNGRRFTCYMTGDLATGRGLVYFTDASNGTSLVEALAAPVFGGAHVSRHREEYDRYDDPRLVALRAVRQAAVDSGPEAARAMFGRIRENPATRPSLDDVLDLGAFLSGRHLAALAIEILRQAVDQAPDSARVHVALGGALEEAGQLPAAIASYRRAVALGGDAEEARQRIRWADERLAARARPVAVPAATLERYAGRAIRSGPSPGRAASCTTPMARDALRGSLRSARPCSRWTRIQRPGFGSSRKDQGQR
jgi:hypothetical protein